jgi:uncharacterized membrane protein YuzA (DUF378 family)
MINLLIFVNPNMGIFCVSASLARLYSTLWGIAGVIVVYRRVLVGNNCVSCLLSFGKQNKEDRQKKWLRNYGIGV